MKDHYGNELKVGDSVSVIGESGMGRWLISSRPDESGECLVKHKDSMMKVHRHSSNLIKNKNP